MRGQALHESFDEYGCEIEDCKGHPVYVKWDDGVEAWECSEWLIWETETNVLAPKDSGDEEN